MFLATALAVLAFALLGLVALRLLRMPVRRYLPSIMLPNSGNMGIPIAYPSSARRRWCMRWRSPP